MPHPSPALLAAMLAGGLAASAQASESAYTRLDVEACPVVREHETGRVHRCRGFADIPVIVDADEHGLFVGIGTGGESATTPLLVSRFAEAGRRIEWRGGRQGGGLKPAAAILRFRITAGPSISAPWREVLAIYRLDPVRSCIAAVVDGRGPDANGKARRLADTLAPRFRCGRDRPVERLR